MPAVAFRKSITPFQRERTDELAVLLLYASVYFPSNTGSIFMARLAKVRFPSSDVSNSFRQLINTPVIVCIFQCTGCILMNLHITRHIAQFVGIIHPRRPGGETGMYRLRSMNQSLYNVSTSSTHTFQISIDQDRS